MRGRERASLAIVLLLGGCSVGTPYRAPEVPIPDSFVAQPAASRHEAHWWTAFDDPVLTGLINRAYADNPDLQQAAARIRQAREQERITRGGGGPQVNASAQAGVTRLSQNALPSALEDLTSGGSGQSPSGGGLGLPGESFATYVVGFDASWELDFFGRQRSANEAAQARAERALWSARDVSVVLAAEVANTYQQYRLRQRRIALAEQILAARREALELAQIRARNGLASDSEARRELRETEQAAAQRDELVAQSQARRHALATLLGLSPTALHDELAGPPAETIVTIDVPPGLPSELLQRRPDVRAAERDVAAATADANVAAADLYPKFSLTGTLQLASRSLTTLLEDDSAQGNAGARVSLPLFDRDRLRATERLRREQAEETVIAYRRTVLTALRDVHDVLSRLDADRRRLDHLRTATLAAREEAESEAVRYRNGLIAASDVLVAQQTLHGARDAQLQAEAANAQDIIALYKALGGGWEDGSGGQGS